jgi:IPT/TIG domain
MARLMTAILLLGTMWNIGAARAANGALLSPITKPPAEQPPKPAPAASCTLLTPEGPRGGRLEVEGQGFGPAPLVRIGGKVCRMIERADSRIAVQIPADSNGGPVTIKTGKTELSCGTLAIIGKD